MGLIDGEEAHISGAKQKLLRERLLAEFVGTFFLVFTVGVAVVGGGPLAAVAIGLILGIQVFCYGSVSGGFFNPAVVLAVLLSGRGKITPLHTAAYMGSQFLGGFFGALIAFIITEKTFCFHYDAFHALDPLSIRKSYSGTAVVLEILFTTALCSSVLHVGTSFDAPNHYFGFVIGLTVTAGAITSGGFDQGSFNPAVTFGHNLVNYFSDKDRDRLGRQVSDDIDTRTPDGLSWVIYIFGPWMGSVIAASIFRGTRGEEYPDGPFNLRDIMGPPPPAGKAGMEKAPLAAGGATTDVPATEVIQLNSKPTDRE